MFQTLICLTVVVNASYMIHVLLWCVGASASASCTRWSSRPSSTAATAARLSNWWRRVWNNWGFSSVQSLVTRCVFIRMFMNLHVNGNFNQHGFNFLFNAIRNNGAWAEACLRTKWYPDPSNRLATIDMGRKVGRYKNFAGRFSGLTPTSNLCANLVTTR